ncbi:MAG: type VII toxin-antitoxin system MntA family adenylyltransferase antitoxin [Verrucomicrobiota bacterium]
MEIRPDQIQRVLAQLAPWQPAVVYLFGSRAGDTARPDSDLDLAVLPGRPPEPWAWFALQGRLSEELGVEVDLVDLTRASTVLRKEIVSTGRLLWEGDPRRRAELEMYALSDYARLNEERAPVLAALGQPLSAYAGRSAFE